MPNSLFSAGLTSAKMPIKPKIPKAIQITASKLEPVARLRNIILRDFNGKADNGS